MRHNQRERHCQEGRELLQGHRRPRHQGNDGRHTSERDVALRRGLSRAQTARLQHPDHCRERGHLLVLEGVTLEGPSTHAHHIEIDAPEQTKEGRRKLCERRHVDNNANIPTVEVGEIQPSRVIRRRTSGGRPRVSSSTPTSRVGGGRNISTSNAKDQRATTPERIP